MQDLAPPNIEATNEDLDKFVRQVKPVLERYIAKRVRNRDHADEIVTRVLEALARTWSSFRGECPSEAYAIHIAANALKNYYARDLQRVAKQMSLDDWVETYSLQHDAESMCPYTRLESAQWVESLLLEMSRCCSDTECGVMGMFYQGQTFDEISLLLGMNASTVRGHFLRGRKKLLVHILMETPELLGGMETFLANVDTVTRQAPDLLSGEELNAIRSRKGSAEVLRSAMVKLAPYLEGIG